MSIWPFRRSDNKKSSSNASQAHARELRIATSGSYSMRAAIETLRVDGTGGYATTGRLRAALFVPDLLTTIQFHAENNKKPSASARASCVHVLQLFTPQETATILEDAKRIGSAIGWYMLP